MLYWKWLGDGMAKKMINLKLKMKTPYKIHEVAQHPFKGLGVNIKQIKETSHP